MGRSKQAPFGYQCPYQHCCPHLEGISTTWALRLIDDSQKDEYRDGHLARELEDENAALRSDLDLAAKRIADLEVRLKTEHKMRFKPNRKSAPERLEPPKRGAPKGHPFWKRRTPDHIDETVTVTAPSVCPHCQTQSLHPTGNQQEQIQEDIVLQPRTRVTRFLHDLAYCPQCRREVFQTGPNELRNCQIGPVTKAVATFLRYSIKVSLRDVRRIFDKLFGMPFVPASAMQFTRSVADAAEPLHELLRNRVRASEVAHGDETSWRLDGKSAYFWYAGTPDFSYFKLDPSRSGDVAVSIFGHQFPGGLVADDYAGYNPIEPKNRQSCLAHLDRKAKDISALITQLPAGQRDAQSLEFCAKSRALFSDVCALGAQRDTGQISFSDGVAKIPALYSRLHAICAHSLAYPDAEAFRQRLLDPKRDYHRLFTFLKVNRMPPTNNHAEQSLRQPVLLRKLTFGNRSTIDAHTLGINLSILQTIHLQKLNPIPILHSLLVNGANHSASSIFANTT
jgi:hypothetical protein